MFDIGWTEMAIVALLALIIIGPKDLPKAMQTVGRWVRRARSLTREFQSGIDDMIREADLDEAKKAIESSRNFSVEKTLSETIDPTGEMKEEARALESAARDTTREANAAAPSDAGPAPTASAPQSSEPTPAEPAAAAAGQDAKSPQGGA